MADNDDSKTLFQMIYASAATKNFESDELDEILNSARRNNTELGVSGMLLYHEGSFIQALEGEQSIVEKLYNKIEKDTRHTDTLILHRTHVNERSFNDWSMGFFRTDRVADEDKSAFNEFLPRGFNQELNGNPEMAQKVLLGFRDGRWRRKVNTG